MSDLAEVMARIRDAVKADKALLGWCQEKYGKSHKIFVGIDEENPPAEGDYPLIGIVPIGHRWGLKSRIETANAIVFCGIVQKAVDTAGNVTELRGVQEIETFRRMIEDRLYKAGLLLAESETRSASEYFFPVFTSIVEVTIETRLSSRGPTAG